LEAISTPTGHTPGCFTGEWNLTNPAALAQGSGGLRAALIKPARQSNGCAWGFHPRSVGIAMIRFLLRFIGLCLLATAFVFFVYDGTKSIANQQLIYVKVSDVWAIVDQNSLNLVQNWLKLKLAWAWDPYLQKAFDLPTWVVLGIVATILILLGRRKRPLIGYARD
jgi:hypothetical protein